MSNVDPRDRIAKKSTSKSRVCKCTKAVQELFATANLHQPYVIDNRREAEPHHLKHQLNRLIICVRALGHDHFIITETMKRHFPKRLDLRKLCTFANELSGNKVDFEAKRYTEKGKPIQIFSAAA